MQNNKLQHKDYDVESLGKLARSFYYHMLKSNALLVRMIENIKGFSDEDYEELIKDPRYKQAMSYIDKAVDEMTETLEENEQSISKLKLL